MPSVSRLRSLPRYRGDDLWLVRVEEVGRLDPINGHSIPGAVPVDGDCLPGAAQDLVGPLVGLRERPVDGVDADEDVGAGVEVLADECFALGGAWLHRL